MTNELDQQLARFTSLMVAIQAASILVVLTLFLAFNYFVKVRLANLAQQGARHAILAGDLRQAMSLLDEVREGEFATIRYLDRSGHLLFSIPSESEELVAPSKPIFGITQSLPLRPSEGSAEQLGRLEFVFSIFSGTAYVLFGAALLVIGSIPISSRYRRKLQKRYEVELAARADSAVARMTQMLAHDVRKPFSILRMGLGMLGGAKDPADVKYVLSRLLPEIDKAVSSVDGLISDVMEVGSTSTQLIQEPVSPESLLESALGEVFRVYPKADISISYDLKHSHMVNVHVQKVGRVFSNILGNAIQAMKSKRQIWFKTTEKDGMLTFCVGNAGPVIPAENLPKLFGAFFTSGKKGGTGLGLAIAQKVVTAHGGRIWCESAQTAAHPEGQVEFFFTLPVATDCPTRTTATLARHSSEIIKALQAGALEADSGSVDKGELTLEADIVQASIDLGRALRVLVVDDEPVYRSSLGAYLHRTPELALVMSVAQAASSDEALAALGSEAFDLIVTDVDLGAASLDGFELVATLRQRSVGALICVHSNRIVAADHRTAIASGADAFLPKPMARAQLLRIVLQSAEQSKTMTTLPMADTAAGRQGAVSASVVAAQPPKPEVLVIDDNPFILDAWQDKLGSEVTIHTMTSQEDLVAKISSDAGFLDRLTYVITDMYLDGSAGDGIEVGRLIKSRCPALAVLLSSDGNFTASELVGAVDRVIGKEPVGVESLRA